jgi:ketosteroid isomerase-like protein
MLWGVTPLDVMQRYVAAVRRFDRDAAFALFADDVVGHVPGRSDLAGERRGREAVMGYINAAVARAHGNVEVEVIDALVGDEHFALLVRERLGTKGDELDIRRANVYRVRGDEISEVWIFEGDQYAVDAYLADGPAGG